VKFAEFDRIRIQCTDLGGNTYDRYFEIMNIVPSQTKSEGTLLTLECLGIEYHTQQIHMAKPFFFENSHSVASVIGIIYNDNRGSEQPVLTTLTADNALPQFNANNWEFGLNEDSCYNRWMDIVDGVGAPVAAGGALTFHEINFETTGINAMKLKIRKSGDNSTIIQVINSIATGVHVGEQEGMLSNPTGTNVMAWGSNEHGTLPVDNSRYNSELLKFIFRPEWVTNQLYAVGARVKVTPTTAIAPKHYKCLIEHTSGTFSTDLTANRWVLIAMGDEFGDNIQYSPWTDGKSTLWSNMGCDPDRAVFTAGGWCDINLNFFRTWVDAIATSDAELDVLSGSGSPREGYAYDSKGSGDNASLPRGFRGLVKSNSPSGRLANFANMIIQFIRISETGQSLEKLYNFTTANTKVQVAVIDEGKIYTDTITGSAPAFTHSWADVSKADYGNDCFHPYTTLPAESDGVDLVNGVTRSEVNDTTNRPDIGDSFTQNQESAVKFISTFGNFVSVASLPDGELDLTRTLNPLGSEALSPLPLES